MIVKLLKSKKRMYVYLIIILICLTGIVIVCYNNYIESFFTGKYEINNFNKNLKNMLKDNYELVIPDSAELQSGLLDHAFRDPSITLKFKVAQNDFNSMFLNNWSDAQNLNCEFPSALYTEILDVHGAKQHMYANLLYEEPKDGFILVYFQGLRPGKISLIF